MAEDGRMTAAQAVDKLMGSEHADVLRESVRFMVDALMEGEVSAMIGAELGERAPERRTTQRNGYRERGWDTRVGEIATTSPERSGMDAPRSERYGWLPARPGPARSIPGGSRDARSKTTSI